VSQGEGTAGLTALDIEGGGGVVFADLWQVVLYWRIEIHDLSQHPSKKLGGIAF
jgi:hypothetical protein